MIGELDLLPVARPLPDLDMDGAEGLPACGYVDAAGEHLFIVYSHDGRIIGTDHDRRLADARLALHAAYPRE